MKPDPVLVEKATAILTGRGVANVDVAIEVLADHRPFSDMDDEDIRPVAEIALDVARRAVSSRRQASQDRADRPGGKPRTPKVLPDTPFRFVSLPDVIAGPEPQACHALNVPIEGGYCATIELTLTAESPLLIGAPDSEDEDGKASRGPAPPSRPVEPVMLDGVPVIPGASLRGMLRSLLEIVALGRLGAANLHHRFPLRDFEHPAYGAGEYPVGVVEKVHAGWLTAEFDDAGRPAFAIAPCGGHGTGWWHVEIDSWSKLGDRTAWLRQGLAQKYAALGMSRAEGRATVFDFTRTENFGPAVRDNDIGARWCRSPLAGGAPLVPVFAGKLPGRDANKRFEFLFSPAPAAAPVAVEPDTADLFVRLSSKRSKNRPEPDGSWKDLLPTLKAGRRIPVFYVGDLADQRKGFFFGLTRLFKVPHSRSVGDVLRQNERPDVALHHAPDKRDVEGNIYRPDFVENLMGYVMEPKDFGWDDKSVDPASVARKGRVACGFMRLQSDAEWKLSDPVSLIQSQPRASYSPFYLVAGRGGAPDYSAEVPPTLAGRKRYLPRDPQAAPSVRLRKIAEMGQRQIARITTDTTRVQSRLRFLLPKRDTAPLTFAGRIRLHNVTAAELGAVFFALTIGEGRANGRFRHMLGRARAFGAGQMRLSGLTVRVVANSGGAAPTVGEAEIKAFIMAFLSHICRETKLPAFPEIPALQQLLFACDPASGAAEEAASRLDYMALGDFKSARDAVKPLRSNAASPWQPAKGEEGRLARSGAITGHMKFWL